MADVTGAKEIHARLLQMIAQTPRELGAALYEEALIVEQTSRGRTPVLTGALRASHETSLPSLSRDSVEVTISVGGPAAPYAVAVHEKVEVRHPVGQAKFLESAVLESIPTLPERLAARIKLGKAPR